MDEKALVFGVSDSVEDLILALLKQKVDLDIEKDYYLNISPPPIPESKDFFDDLVISGIFVDVNKTLLNKILSWLQRKKNLKNPPKLKLVINGNLLDINISGVKILLRILKDCSDKNNYGFNV